MPELTNQQKTGMFIDAISAEWTKAFTVIAKMFYDLLESFR